MITRKQALLAFFGIGAAGQTVKLNEAYPVYTIPKDGNSGGYLRPKPRNGECPVCGTMAKKYDRWDIGMMPPHELVRCAHCSAAFWQDAESK